MAKFFVVILSKYLVTNIKKKLKSEDFRLETNDRDFLMECVSCIEYY